MTTPQEIKKILLEDMSQKKQFQAHRDTYCDICNNDIPEGEDFCFMGSKKKVCSSCQGDVISWLEE